MNLPAEGVYVKSAKLSKQHGRDIYFKIARHPRGASLYFNLFDEEPQDLEHAVKMHSDLSRVTTRVCAREACGGWLG